MSVRVESKAEPYSLVPRELGFKLVAQIEASAPPSVPYLSLTLTLTLTLATISSHPKPSPNPVSDSVSLTLP